MSHDAKYRTVWGRPQAVVYQRPKDLGRGRPLALHRGPSEDVHWTSFGDVLRTSGPNLTEWEDAESTTKNKSIKLLPQLKGFKFMKTLVLVFKMIESEVIKQSMTIFIQAQK